MPATLGFLKFEASRSGIVTLTEMSVFTKSLADCPADLRLDYLAACSAAFLDAGLFHRDASLGNIMIGLDDEGRLNDWDPCRGADIGKSLEGPRTVRTLSRPTALVLTSIYP